jgi:hypothetical protein
MPLFFRCALRVDPEPLRIDACGPVTDFIGSTGKRVIVREAGGFHVVPPEVAIGVASGDYQRYAPDPESDDRGPIPREGIYLVEITTPGELPLGRIIGRVGVPEGPVLSTPLSWSCGRVDPGICERVARRAAADVLDAVSVAVKPYTDACFRARLCPPPTGGWPYQYSAAVTAADDSVSGRGCDDIATGANCVPIDVADVMPLGTLRFDVRSTKPVVHELSSAVWLMVGKLEDEERQVPARPHRIIAQVRDPDDLYPIESIPHDAPPPPGWCAATVDVAPRVVYAVTVTAHGDSCTIEIVDTGERRD